MKHGPWSASREVHNSSGKLLRLVRWRRLAGGMVETQERPVGARRWTTTGVCSGQ